MILYLKASEEEVKKDIDGMKEALKTTKYVCSFGYCMREEDDDIFKVAKEADAKMYKEKIKLKDAQDRLLATYKIATIEVMHEALHSGMWGMEFDENGKMCSVEWSPQFRKMIGFTDENDFPNTLEAWSSRLHPDEKEYVLKEFNDTINDYSNNKTYDVRYRLQVKDGQWKKFHALGRIIRREDGTPYSYVGMFVEVTDEKNVGDILHN